MTTRPQLLLLLLLLLLLPTLEIERCVDVVDSTAVFRRRRVSNHSILVTLINCVPRGFVILAGRLRWTGPAGGVPSDGRLGGPERRRAAAPVQAVSHRRLLPTARQT